MVTAAEVRFGKDGARQSGSSGGERGAGANTAGDNASGNHEHQFSKDPAAANSPTGGQKGKGSSNARRAHD
jgi:hypothetical protein